MTGKLMAATMCLYSDDTFTTQIAAIPIVVGIAVGSTSSMLPTNITGVYSTFSERVYDVAALGGSYIYPSSLLPSDDKYRPNLYFPACAPKVNSSYNYDAYYRIVFKDGRYLSPGSSKISDSAGHMHAYDKNGVDLAEFGSVFWEPYNSEDSSHPSDTIDRFSYATLVVSEMNPDGTIPDTATLAIYSAYPTRPTPGTLRILGMIGSYGTIGADKAAFFNGIPALSKDPYQEVDPAGPGGGTSVYDPYSTDDIDYESLPEVSAVGTGFLSLWCPTEQQMLNLSAYIWNADIATLDFWRRLVADPIQLIYGLNIIPLDLRAKGIVGSSPEDVVVGTISTRIKMDYLTSQWVELDCGTIDVNESLLGSYLDYDPFTKVDIYLPYIGYRPLRVDDLMPGTVSLKYKIDLLTGSCIAQIKSTKSAEHNDVLDSIVYQFMGNCATQVPVTASQYADAVRSALALAAAVGTIATLAGAGGAAGAPAGAEIMPTVEPAGLLNSPGMVPVDSQLGMSMARYNYMTAIPPATNASGGVSPLRQAAIIHSAASAGSNVMGIKPSIERSGAIGGSAGMLSIQIPYLVFTRPRIAHPEEQSKYTGYPSFITQKLSELEGFTQIQAIHLEGLPCTTNELAELDALLKSGVIF